MGKKKNPEVSSKKASKEKTTKEKAIKKKAVKKKITKKKAIKDKEPQSKPVETAESGGINREQRLELIRTAAYHLAEQRGFHPGLEMDDWLLAEQDIEEVFFLDDDE